MAFHSWPVVAVFKNSSSLTIGMFSVQVSALPTLCSCSEHLLKPDTTQSKKKKKRLKKKAALNLGNASKSWSSGNMADWMGSSENMKCSITARWWGVTSEEPVSVKSVWKRKERKLHTIFLMLLRLKLPALLCFCTWLADSWSSSSTVTVPSGGGEFNILLVDSWRETKQPVTLFSSGVKLQDWISQFVNEIQPSLLFLHSF